MSICNLHMLTFVCAHKPNMSPLQLQSDHLRAWPPITASMLANSKSARFAPGPIRHLS